MWHRFLFNRRHYCQKMWHANFSLELNHWLFLLQWLVVMLPEFQKFLWWKFWGINYSRWILKAHTAQKVNFSIKDFFSKCDQICKFLYPESAHLLKKSLMENVNFFAVTAQNCCRYFKPKWPFKIWGMPFFLEWTKLLFSLCLCVSFDVIITVFCLVYTHSFLQNFLFIFLLPGLCFDWNDFAWRESLATADHEVFNELMK